MTHPAIDKLWQGATVAVLGNSPSLRDHLKRLPAHCQTIAASRAIEVYPQAEMLVTIDGNVPEGFGGLNVVGVPTDCDAIYAGMHYERAEIAPGHVIEFRNTGLLAIRVAAMTGASRIVLAGFDTDAYEARYDGAYPGITQAFRALVADLRARGVEVVDMTEETTPAPTAAPAPVPTAPPAPTAAPVDAHIETERDE